MSNFSTLKMTAKWYTVLFAFAVLLGGGLASKKHKLKHKSDVGTVRTVRTVGNTVPDEYILTGSVMDDEAALIALKREVIMTYELNLPKYLDEMHFAHALQHPSNDFTDQDFAVVGSLATLDASIVLGEGIRNLKVISAATAAGFQGRPDPTNDRLHNRVQRLNAFRNVMWLMKEKLKTGVVQVDAPLMDKLREAQTWLSTQTGGHLGQAMTSALDGSGLMARLETKWGATSIKFRSFQAVAANGLDFAINGYNTVVNSIALNQNLTDANVLALSSSLGAMAGDVAMGVTQVILSSGAKVASAAGPIGYGIAATLYVASYATGVASGIVSQENLQPKDYVKAFLGPVIPSPDFTAMVDMVDAITRGDTLTAYSIYMTRSVPAALVMGGMALVDKITGSNNLEGHVSILSIIIYLDRLRRYQKQEDNFKKEIKGNVQAFVRNIKPKKFLYAFPSFNDTTKYTTSGWSNADNLKRDFGITSDLTNKVIFMATYAETFKRPAAFPGSMEYDQKTFVPQVVPHGDDPFLFLGNDKMDDVILLDGNSEAYGLGGDDTISVHPGWGSTTPGPVKINGGKGSDTISTLSDVPYEGIEYYLTGGGPERDHINGGYGNDFVHVENDVVKDFGGENTFYITGNGDDVIEAGPGASVVFIDKTSGPINVKFGETRPYAGRPETATWRSRRIVYRGDSLVASGTVSTDRIKLCGAHQAYHDVLSMTKYHPVDRSANPSQQMIVLMYDHRLQNPIRMYFDYIKDVRNQLFKHTRCTRNSGSGNTEFCPEAQGSQQIFFDSIERFELSKHTVNLLFLSCVSAEQMRHTHEVVGGPFDDYIVVPYGRDIPLMAQLGAGANRVYAGKADDSYSLILDEQKDIIYDKGGRNLVAVMIPEGLSFENVFIKEVPAQSSYHIAYKYHVQTEGGLETRQEIRLEFIFGDPDKAYQDHFVRFLFKERSGKEIVFKQIRWPGHNPNNHLSTFKSLKRLYDGHRPGSYSAYIESKS